MMRRIAISVGCMILTSQAFGGTPVSKTEIVEEIERNEVKVFCSKISEKDAASLCDRWLAIQTKALGTRLLTSYCSAGEIVSQDASCLYRVTGELKYVLKKYKTEEKSN